MFKRKPDSDPQLQEAIDSVYADLKGFTSETDNHRLTVDQLTALYKLKELNSKNKVSADTVALISGNLLGIVMIVGYERANVITSKGMQFVKGLAR